MALFGSKKKTEETKTETKLVAPMREAASGTNVGIAHVLKNPRITEKASDMQSVSIYTFDVATSATKSQVAAAVRSVYKVTPRKIRMVQVPSKKTRNIRTGRSGTRTGGKKAYVHLQSGETITIA